jgi:uncharacterized membrane protein YedE/YeeE
MTIEQILGLLTGVAFGFILQRARVLRYEKQIGAMLLQDMTILKFMLSSILVGMCGILLLQDMGIITLAHKSMNFGGVLIGGALFGIGWAVMGFCPGTSVGAIGEGRWHAIFGALGMIIGAAIYAEIYPFLKNTVLSWADIGKVGVADILGTSHWMVAIVFTFAVLFLFKWFEKKKL